MIDENSTQITVCSRKIIQSKDFATIAHIETSNDNELTKVLDIESYITLNNIEVSNDELAFSGSILYNIVALTKTGKFETIEQSIEISGILNGSFNQPICLSEILNNHSTIKDTEILIETAFRIDVENLISENINNPDINPNVFIKSSNINYRDVMTRSMEKFSVVDEFDLSENINRVIGVNSLLLQRDSTIKDDVIVVEFDIIKDITYTYGDEEMIKTERKTQSFRQELPIASIREPVVLDNVITLKSTKINLTYNEKENRSVMMLVFGLTAEIVSYKDNSSQVISDAFCINNELLLSKEGFEINSFEGRRSYNEKISNNINIKDEVQELITAMQPQVVISSQKIEDGKIILEGVIISNLIYKIYKDGKITNSIASAPFTTSFNCGEFSDNCDVLVKADARVISQRNRGSNGIEIIYDVYFNVAFNSSIFISFISSIKEGELKEDIGGAISIVKLEKNDDIFDMAKSLNISPNIILTQNDEEKIKETGFATVFRQTNG